MNKIVKGLIIFLSLTILILLVLVIYLLFFKEKPIEAINDYDSCVKAGNTVQETNPPVCITKDGKSFVQDIDGNQLANPASVFCEENGGKLNIIEEENGQVGYCEFDTGKKCEEWAYYRGECSSEVTTSTLVTLYMFDRNKYNTTDENDYFSTLSRSTERKDVATFAVEELIKGPSNTDPSYLDKTFGEDAFIWFDSTSNCNNKDFTIKISNKLATVQFCKTTMMAGDLAGGIVTDQIVKTLKQFSTIEKVKVLNVSGGCLNDLSGLPSSQCIY